MASGHLKQLLDKVDAGVENYIFNSYAGLAAEMSSTLRIMFVLFLVLYGVSVMQGWIRTSLPEFIQMLVRMLFIFIFATFWNVFSAFAYELFTQTPNQVAGVLLSSAGGSLSNADSVNEVLGGIYDKTISSASQLIFKSDTWAFGTKLHGLLLAVLVIGMIIYALFLIVLAKIAVAILLGLSPLFIAFMLFSATRGLFEGWLRQLLNFAFIPALTYGILIFVVSLNNDSVTALKESVKNGSTGNMDIYPVLLSAGISIILLMQVMGIAAGIAGGMQLSTLGSVGAAMRSIKGQRLGLPGGGNAKATHSVHRN